MSMYLQSVQINHYLPFGARLWSGTRSQAAPLGVVFLCLRRAIGFGVWAVGLGTGAIWIGAGMGLLWEGALICWDVGEIDWEVGDLDWDGGEMDWDGHGFALGRGLN